MSRGCYGCTSVQFEFEFEALRGQKGTQSGPRGCSFDLGCFSDPACGITLVGCAAVYFAVGFGAGAVLGARPAAARVVSIVSGVAMIVIGVVLLVGQLVR